MSGRITRLDFMHCAEHDFTTIDADEASAHIRDYHNGSWGTHE